MLKWTASAQKSSRHSTFADSPIAANMLHITPQISDSKRWKRRATIANKENVPNTSTPMVQQQSRTRNSPIVIAPLMDILNITPESLPTTPDHRRVNNNRVRQKRRHSTLGLTLPSAVPQYARTLPRYEEEYSPSADLPTGQQLALRGIVHVPFLGKTRYFTTPDIARQTRVECEFGTLENKALPSKRKLDSAFAEVEVESEHKFTKPQAKQLDLTTLDSAEMGDETLDKLIDAILDSARKNDKEKKKPSKSFNLRRRTLLKNQAECSNDLNLSPSYAPGDDPASDLNFFICEPLDYTVTCKPSVASVLTRTVLFTSPETPMARSAKPGSALSRLEEPCGTTFILETPLPTKGKKRRKQSAPSNEVATPPKKFKVDAQNYFEVGVALPSIYV